jgi:hypothetical protein
MGVTEVRLRLRAARLRRRLRPRLVDRRLAWPPGTVAEFERGRLDLAFDDVIELLRAYGLFSFANLEVEDREVGGRSRLV